MTRVKYGLTLSNRSVLLGMSTVSEMLDLAVEADRAEVWDSVWLGDSIFAKPRLDALVALGALAARTDRVRLGVGCMASMPLRDALLLAYQWLSFDCISEGRSIFVACQGQREAGGGLFEEEFAAFGIDPATRSRRMEEAIEILRLVSETENASYEGAYNRFENVTVLPRPVQRPLPIWVTANPNPAFPKLAERALRRVARLGDGWMTTANTPSSFSANLDAIRRYADEEGRPLDSRFEACLYYNIHVTDGPGPGHGRGGLVPGGLLRRRVRPDLPGQVGGRGRPFPMCRSDTGVRGSGGDHHHPQAGGVRRGGPVPAGHGRGPARTGGVSGS